MQEIKKKFAKKRITTVLKDELAFTIAEDDELKPIKDVYVCYSERNAIKKIFEKSFNISSRSGANTSTLNEVHKFIVKTKTNIDIILFTNYGNMYKVAIDNILETRWKDRGTLLSDMFLTYQKDERVVGMFAENELKNKELLFVTTSGVVRKTKFEEFATKKDCVIAYKLKDDDKVLSVEKFEPNSTLLFVTDTGITLNADISDVACQSKTSSGVKGIKLDEAKLIAAAQVNETDKVVVATDSCFAKIVSVSEIGLLPRNRKGVKIISLGDNGKTVLYAHKVLKDPFEIFTLDAKEKPYFISTDNLSVESRNSKGKSFAGKKGTKVKQIYTYLWKEIN